jgi:hypothetical protein
MIPTTPTEIQRAKERAAARTFEGLTRLLRDGACRNFEVRVEAGRFFVEIRTPSGRIIFGGKDVQDACAQAINTLALDAINADDSE